MNKFNRYLRQTLNEQYKNPLGPRPQKIVPSPTGPILRPQRMPEPEPDPPPIPDEYCEHGCWSDKEGNLHYIKCDDAGKCTEWMKKCGKYPAGDCQGFPDFPIALPHHTQQPNTQQEETNKMSNNRLNNNEYKSLNETVQRMNEQVLTKAHPVEPSGHPSWPSKPTNEPPWDNKPKPTQLDTWCINLHNMMEENGCFEMGPHPEGSPCYDWAEIYYGLNCSAGGMNVTPSTPTTITPE